MGLTKTDKARAELQPGQRSLGQRERAVLLLADGRKTVQEVGACLGPDAAQGERLVLQLLRDGYLARAQPEPVAADRFDGARSLATTRMFLFDLCERLFARRAPVQADTFRACLRSARDADAMLVVGEQMLAEIARHAGPERADSIRARIALLLPEAALAA